MNVQPCTCCCKTQSCTWCRFHCRFRLCINIKRELQVFDKFNKDAFLDVSLFTINKKSEDYKYIAIAQDITERKNKEKKLKQSYTVFNNTKDGIVITDKYTNIVDVNRSFELITGYEKKDIYKLRLFEGDSIVLDNI